MGLGQETPLHPPYPRGDRTLRQANQKPHVEYWHELLAYIDSAYVQKLGSHYPWNNLARKNLWNMARVHSAWGVMALWELYLEGNSAWARRTAWSVYGMIRDAGRLMDDLRFKHLAAKHEESLARQRFGRFAKASDVLSRFTGTSFEVMLPNPNEFRDSSKWIEEAGCDGADRTKTGLIDGGLL